MGRECSTHGEMRNAYTVLVGKLRGRDLLGVTRRFEYNTESGP